MDLIDDMCCRSEATVKKCRESLARQRDEAWEWDMEMHPLWDISIGLLDTIVQEHHDFMSQVVGKKSYRKSYRAKNEV